jgi:hypothetical protein
MTRDDLRGLTHGRQVLHGGAVEHLGDDTNAL